MRRIAGMVLFLSVSCCISVGTAQNTHRSWSARIADSFIASNPDTIFTAPEKRVFKWNYDQSLIFEALYQTWLASGDQKYFSYLQRNLDHYLTDDGTIKTYKLSDYNIDMIASGRQLLYLHKVTGIQKYKNAADTLRKQLQGQPRTKEGGFWHKKIYPYQMWLDGLYMGEPFYAIYAAYYDEPRAYDDIAQQFIWIEKHTRDSSTGLLYHAWDESRQQKWANPMTGCSPHFWGRAMGWYVMALVDVLDYLPGTHPERRTLVAILQRTAAAILSARDPHAHLWWQIMNLPGKGDNYLEASASAMFTYAFAKGANEGYLEKKYYAAALESFTALRKKLVTIDDSGSITLHQTCQGAGLGGNPYRDGSFEYYMSEPKRDNDLKGYGPFWLAALEFEKGGEAPK
ncbi:MAG: glycoside hydrolase family 88 protein [Ignavibacteriales bacterium]|nr:glycoside hydrolase family 88 protein [Ignavibacteriales bacterium]